MTKRHNHRDRLRPIRPIRRLLTSVEVHQVRRFGRSLLSVLFGVNILILHTTGRRSGVERSTPLAYVDRGGSLLVVGGAGGQAQIPDWVANLRAAPRAAVTVDRRRSVVRADELVDDERAARWPELAEAWPRIEVYERRAGRQVPVFRLTPVDDRDTGGS